MQSRKKQRKEITILLKLNSKKKIKKTNKIKTSKNVSKSSTLLDIYLGDIDDDDFP